MFMKRGDNRIVLSPVALVESSKRKPDFTLCDILILPEK